MSLQIFTRRLGLVPVSCVGIMRRSDSVIVCPTLRMRVVCGSCTASSHAGVSGPVGATKGYCQPAPVKSEHDDVFSTLYGRYKRAECSPFSNKSSAIPITGNQNFMLKMRHPVFLSHTQFFHVLSSNALCVKESDTVDLDDRFCDDPEVKEWLKEMNDDFQAEITKVESEDSESTSSSDSESEGESSSSSSDSDSDSGTNVDDKHIPAAGKVYRTADGGTTAGETGRETADGVSSVESSLYGVSEDTVSTDVSAKQTSSQITPNEEVYEYEDFYEEEEDEEEEQVYVQEEMLPISLQRGQHGVFDVDELVTLLTEEKGDDVCVIDIAQERKYVEHMVIVTGRSTRHLKAMAALVRWTFKNKRGNSDPLTVKIEGENCQDWVAMDLGNIALHLFLRDTREKYDLETLWTVGYDPKEDEPGLDEDPFALYIDQNFTFDPKDLKSSSQEMEKGSMGVGETPRDVDKESERSVEPTDSKTNKPRNRPPGMESFGGWHAGR